MPKNLSERSVIFVETLVSNASTRITSTFLVPNECPEINPRSSLLSEKKDDIILLCSCGDDDSDRYDDDDDDDDGDG